MHSYKFSIVITLSLLSASPFATCNIKDANELFTIIKSSHPEIEYNESLDRAFSETLNVAKELPNPELEVSREQGKTAEGKRKVTSLGLSFPIELGGKRDARKNIAISSTRRNKSILRLSSEDAYIKSILSSYRLRQIIELLPVYDEAVESLEKILKIKSRRKSLSPEEEVEKETLSLATNDYRLKISRIKSEKRKLAKELSLAMGMNCELTLRSLPSDLDLSKEYNSKNLLKNSALLVKAKESIEVARSQMAFAKADAFPDLSVGPTLEIENIEGRSFKTYGIAISMGLPVFNLNSGSRKKAASEFLSAKLNHKHVERHVAIEQESLIEKYNSFKKALRGIATKEELERKHDKIEKLFGRGVISTSLIIESHRQLIEFANTRFEFELGAVDAILNINKINGTVFSSKL